jgi:hypothetical protein
MKLIEAMKQVKDLQRKADDLKDKVKQHCADYEHETPPYGKDQRATINGWLDAHRDVVKEILRLRLAIQKTNMGTDVTIKLGEENVTKTIAAWILRRGQGREMGGLAHEELKMWSCLTDRGLKEDKLLQSSGQILEKKIRRYFDPAQKDRMRELFTAEPMAIDSALEVTNAVTDLIEG